MNKIVYDLLLKLEQCDDKHKRCDYLMEHDEITYLLEYIEMLEERRKQNIKQQRVLDKIKEYANNCLENLSEYDYIVDDNIDIVELKKNIHNTYLELLEEIE